MLSNNLKNVVRVAILLQSISSIAYAEESIHWSYVGRTGPDHWSKLDKAFEACSEGVKQSPIDLNHKTLVNDKAPIIFHYDSHKVALKEYSIKVSNEPSKHIEIAGKTYKLIQFHFHMPSEHSVDNKTSDAELHFVHQDNDGNLAVVGVFIKEGKSNKLIKAIAETATKSNEAKYTLEDSNLMSLLPENKEYFHYMGSLTTPPCTEGINWYVLKTPIEASKAEIMELKSTIQHNSRPIQDAKGRVAQ